MAIEGGGPMGRSGQKPSLRKALGVFQHRNYRLLWISSTFSFTGMQMQQVARALLAWELTESFAWLGWIALSFGLPMLLFALIGGAVADRVDKRNLTFMTQSTTAILALITAAMIIQGSMTIEWLFAIGLVQGTFFAFGMPARMPLMAEVVGRDQLMSAIALSNAAMNATRLFGPAIAGLLVAWRGVEAAYLVQGALYICSSAILLGVPTGLSKVENGGFARPPQGNMFVEIGRGLRYAATNPPLRLLILMMFASTLFAMPHVLLLAGFVQRDLGQGPGAFGSLQAIAGIGAVIASIGVATFTEFDRKPLVQWIAGVLSGLGLILLAVGSSVAGFPGAIVAVAVLGLALTAYQTLNNTMSMDETRPEYYGRVMSINMLSFSAMPLMAAPLGILADVIGAYALFTLMGVVLLGVMVVVAVVSPGYTFGRSTKPAWQREAAEGMPRPVAGGGIPGHGGAGTPVAGPEQR
ncbi:MAG: MFS transporter [Chloroflexi bacterium]|nr:MFS transporter [Chloroflexota bacterium]MDA1240625.1 MFS transporter [Chloroflexota bacterium]